MEDILFIVNPVAGGGKAESFIDLIREEMKKNDIKFKIIITERAKQATKISEENSSKYKLLVAVGGDGTVNEVARGIINRNQGVLGILPGGTGNDMARSLGIPLNIKDAIKVVLNGNRKEIDIGQVNTYNFLNIASVGFDAEVVVNNERIKKSFKGQISYAISVIYTLFKFKNKIVNLEIDGERLDEDIFLLAVGNGKYYGGGMKILPMAKVDDGYLDICVILNISKLLVLYLFPTIFKGNHIRYSRYVKLYKAKEINIISKKEFFLNIDGEIIKTNKASFSLLNKKIQIIS